MVPGIAPQRQQKTVSAPARILSRRSSVSASLPMTLTPAQPPGTASPSVRGSEKDSYEEDSEDRGQMPRTGAAGAISLRPDMSRVHCECYCDETHNPLPWRSSDGHTATGRGRRFGPPWSAFGSANARSGSPSR